MTRPSVGVFWRLLDRSGTAVLVAESTPLDLAETYGDCLTFADSHHDVWERWRAAPAAVRAKLGVPETMCEREYDETPRGRIVFHRPSETFWLYADRRLQNVATVAEITQRFGLARCRVEVRSDAHYR